MSEKELREYKRLKSAEWRNKNYDRYRSLIRGWQVKNPEKTRLYRAARRHRMSGIKIDTSKICNWASRICGICGEAVAGPYHLDHIIPMSRGGIHAEHNLQVTHPTCNQRKFTKLQEELTVDIINLEASPELT